MNTLLPFQRLAAAFCTMILLIAGSTPAAAHFNVDAKTRTLHLVDARTYNPLAGHAPADQGLRLIIRIPGPLAFAEALSQRKGPLDPIDAPFVKKVSIEGVPYYVLDKKVIAKDPSGFSAFLASGYRISVNHQPANALAVRAVIHSSKDRPHFSTPEEIATTFTQGHATADDIYVGDSLIDLELLLPTAASTDHISIKSTLPEINVPQNIVLDNLAMDHRSSPVISQKILGQLQTPVVFDGSMLTSLLGFAEEGVLHILQGYDHVLFLICLAMASGLSGLIVWSVTGFTLGHSVSLALSWFGYAPSAPWFLPAIEISIALSIVFTALLILFRNTRALSGRMQNRFWFLSLTTLIGLLHGFGFSTLLLDLTGGSANQIWAALAGFNLGLEAGQLVIVACVMVVYWISAGIGESASKGLRYTTAGTALLIASYWAIERSLGV